jgi:predicted RNA binding protein YcfA (HicA-like mRNA interferase family)
MRVGQALSPAIRSVHRVRPHWTEAGQRGSHVKFARRSGEVVDTAIVPKKREVPVGTLRSILSQAHVSPDDCDNLV